MLRHCATTERWEWPDISLCIFVPFFLHFRSSFTWNAECVCIGVRAHSIKTRTLVLLPGSNIHTMHENMCTRWSATCWYVNLWSVPSTYLLRHESKRVTLSLGRNATVNRGHNFFPSFLRQHIVQVVAVISCGCCASSRLSSPSLSLSYKVVVCAFFLVQSCFFSLFHLVFFAPFLVTLSKKQPVIFVSIRKLGLTSSTLWQVFLDTTFLFVGWIISFNLCVNVYLVLFHRHTRR